MAEAEVKYDSPAMEEKSKGKQKRKQLTTEEKLAAAKAKINAVAARAAERAKATQAKRNAKKAESKATRETKKRALRNQLVAAVMNKAAQNQFSLQAENVKIPAVAAKMNNVEKYYQAAKKRYYARTQKPSSIRRQALQQAVQEGIPHEYVKQTVRTKTVNDILDAARKRYRKNTEKTAKTTKRKEIMEALQAQFGLSEIDAMKTICVRKKAEKKAEKK